MDGEELKNLLANRLYLELELFRDSMLRQDRREIYGASYMIEIYVNLYIILTDNMKEWPENTVRWFLYRNYGILDFLYQEWLSRNDGFYDELADYVRREMDKISQIRTRGNGKENGYEEQYNQAA